MRPSVIVTRTTATIFLTICLLELMVFNLIANYAHGVNPSASILVLLFGLIFYFLLLTHKHKKMHESDKNGNSSYAVGAFTLFVMIVGVWLMLIS
jgi:hypothetical protein